MKQSKRSLKLVVSDTNVSVAQRTYIKNYLSMLRTVKIIQFLILVIFLATWEITTRLNIIDSFVFSSPTKVVNCFLEMAKDGEIFYHIGITLAETFISFALVIVIGILVAVLLWWNEKVSRVFEPYLVVLNSLPKSALAPVFIVWLGANMKTIIVAAVSVAVFGSIITLYTNFKEVEEDKLKLIRTLGGTKKDILFKVILPSNIPVIISVMKVNIGLSLVGVIIGEFLAAKAGLGYLIIYGSQVFRLDWVIMSIVILCILATILYKVLTWIEKKYNNR
ncbi:MAG: ABC transporter permease [bacterium]|nr:ABC transporter permease [bacterium]